MSVFEPIDYMQQLEARYGTEGVRSFFRLYVVPGMVHTSGGPATDQYDALSALVGWVEHRRYGQLPSRAVWLAIVAGVFFAGDLLAWHHAVDQVGADEHRAPRLAGTEVLDLHPQHRAGGVGLPHEAGRHRGVGHGVRHRSRP